MHVFIISPGISNLPHALLQVRWQKKRLRYLSNLAAQAHCDASEGMHGFKSSELEQPQLLISLKMIPNKFRSSLLSSSKVLLVAENPNTVTQNSGVYRLDVFLGLDQGLVDSAESIFRMVRLRVVEELFYLGPVDLCYLESYRISD